MTDNRQIVRPAVGVVTFADQRDEFYARRKHIAEEEMGRLTQKLDSLAGIEVIRSGIVRSKEGLTAAANLLNSRNAAAVVISLPIWSPPNLTALASQLLPVPILLFGNERLDSSSQVALLAAGGALDQIGCRHVRVVGDIGEESVLARIDRFFRACLLKNRLNGNTFGSFGGRSVGIHTTTADLSQWVRQFGIDIEHIDQYEIVRRAEMAERAAVTRHRDWLVSQVGHIEYHDSSFTGRELELQIRSYLAVKAIVAEMKLDFVGIKCQTEMSDHYVLQCLNLTMLNDPYDADGDKEPVAASCECDHDGALTMQMLKYGTGGKPVLFLDVRHVHTGGLIGANCGSMPTWFTRYASEPGINLAQAHLIPHVFGKAGGCAVQLVAGSSPVTLARLCRKDGRYWMALAEGRIVDREREALRQTTWAFPHAFIELPGFAKDDFLQTFGSNHIHVGVGRCSDLIEEMCRLYAIECVRYNRQERSAARPIAAS